MDATTKTEVVEKGVAVADILAIIGFADTLQAANSTKKSSKTKRPGITAHKII